MEAPERAIQQKRLDNSQGRATVYGGESLRLRRIRKLVAGVVVGDTACGNR